MRGTRSFARSCAVLATVVLATVGLSACTPAPTVLSGTVSTSNGQGAGQVTVAAFGATTDATPVASTTTDFTGQFGFTSATLPDGTYVVSIDGQWWTGSGLSTTAADATTIQVGGGAPQVVITTTLSTTTSVTGYVTTTDGTAVDGQLVGLEDTAGSLVTAGYTTNGTFSLPVAHGGTYHVALLDVAANKVVHIGGASPTPFTVADGTTVNVETLALTTPTAIGVGGNGGCALRSDGSVACWGSDQFGQLGDFSGGNSATPVNTWDYADSTPTTAITVGAVNACALHTSGSITCWGSNYNGELGTGSTATTSDTPVKVTGITDATAITAESHTVCAVHATGTVSCWGANSNGQVGDGTKTNASSPVTVPGITDATAVSTGDTNSCALHATGAVSCWGNDQYGQLGDGNPGGESLTPVTVSGITDATAISSSDQYSCALRAGGSVSCWGIVPGLPPSDGTGPVFVSTPVPTGGFSDAVAISAGPATACAVHATGTISCWGDNSSGQLGNGATTNGTVTGITDATAVSSGSAEVCAVRASGTASCWGAHSLGNGTWDSSNTPVAVTGFPVRVS